jgi:hypothetical protein
VVSRERLAKWDRILSATKGRKVDWEVNAPSFYTVDLPDEHIAKMLDWDAPLSEQPEAARDSLARLVSKTQATTYELEKAVSRYEKKLQKMPKYHADYQSTWDKWKSATMQLEAAQGGWGDKSISDLYYILSSANGGPEGASKALKEAGIPGIKYMDGNSRGYTVDLTYKGKPYAKHEGHKFQTLQQARDYADEQIAKGFGAKVGTDGTRNFVIFDGDTAKILKRE